MAKMIRSKADLEIVKEVIGNNQIQEWWNEYFPDETLQSVETPSGGATTQTFILNRNKLLKVYISKDGSEIKYTFYKNTSLAMEVLENSDFFSSRVLCESTKSKVFEAPFVCYEFIESTDLSNILYKLNPDEQFTNGKKIGEIIKKLHTLTTISDQEYNTQNLLDLVQKALYFESEHNLLDTEIKKIMTKFVSEYKPRIIKTDFVLVHNDLHPENYLRDVLERDFLIDFDMSFVGWKIFELRKLLYAALIPKYLVNKKLDGFYPNKSMITFFKGLISVYPELLKYEFLDEIKLLMIPQGLNNLKRLQGLDDFDLTQDLFRMIFKENVLETLIHNN
jgi:aminoglycoside phosphotransferase (APT) family kinase protein